MEENCIHIVFGPTGSGKTTYSISLSEKNKAVRFSIDQWLKTLFFDDLQGPPDLDWLRQRFERCENQIWSLCCQAMDIGFDVILDLGLPGKAHREKIIKWCQDHGFNYQLYFVKAKRQERKKRVFHRNQEKSETFEFGIPDEIFDLLESWFEEPTEEELSSSIVICTDDQKG